MKLGLLTAAFPGLSLEEIAEWAASEGFETLEIACWPAAGGERRRYAGVTHLDVESFDPDQVHELLGRHGLEISSLAYYPNNLHPDDTEREAVEVWVHCSSPLRAFGEGTVSIVAVVRLCRSPS